MSTIEDGQALWSNISNEPLNSKYEKCRNITEEIYKRINITFQIKKLETTQSDVSDFNNSDDQIDSNEISNETDLFACDKTSISSSTEPEKTERPVPVNEKYININNNEETKVKKPVMVNKRPRKRFRKRVKKRQSKTNRSDTDGSSDEALPLSRIVDIDTKCDSADEERKSESPDIVMGVPKIIITTKDLKLKMQTPDKKTTKKDTDKTKNPECKDKEKSEKDYAQESKDNIQSTEKVIVNGENTETAPATPEMSVVKDKKNIQNGRNCSKCNLFFKGDRGLRRHMTMSDIEEPQVQQN